jgi:hypothetical protein
LLAHLPQAVAAPPTTIWPLWGSMATLVTEVSPARKP